MKINLRKLKLRQEEAVNFLFTDKLNDQFLTDSDAALSEPTEIKLEVKRQNAVYYGQGTLKTTIEYSCSRCLKKFTQPLALDLSFIITEAENQTEFDEEVILLSNDEADLTFYIEGVIFAQVPLNPICSTDCRGLCPLCGKDKNANNCNCHIDDIDPRWEKLKKYK